MAVGLAVGGWWWVQNLLVHGTLQPDGLGLRTTDPGVQTRTFGDYLPEALTRFGGSFWGVFGWLEVPLPSP